MDDITQSPATNIEQDININTYIIYGKMGGGKTLLSIMMSTDFIKRIYSNFDIFQNGKKINKTISSYIDCENIRFSFTPGILIIDEAGINANSKDGRSLDNRILQNLLFLSRKKNVNLVWIAQRFESIDVNARVLADAILEVRKMRRRNKPPYFVVVKKKQRGTNLDWIYSYSVDTIGFMNFFHLTYNQLEESKMKKRKTIEEEEKNNKFTL